MKRRKKEKGVLFSMSFTSPMLTSDVAAGDRQSAQRPSLCFVACLRVRGTYEPGWVLVMQRGCLITCLSAFDRIYCSWSCLLLYIWTQWEPYGEKLRMREELMGQQGEQPSRDR